jgi:hypothetical protein
LPPGPRVGQRETTVLDDCRKAEAVHAARLARVAGRLGALDDRLRRGPEGWRHRLALIEAANLCWFAGDRIGRASWGFGFRYACPASGTTPRRWLVSVGRCAV